MLSVLSFSLFVHLSAMLLSQSLTWIILLLISTFINLFLVLLCATAEFFAISFLMIYVGAIAILLVFALMVVRSDTKLPRVVVSGSVVLFTGFILKLILVAVEQINTRFSYEALSYYLVTASGFKAQPGLMGMLEVTNEINIFGMYLYNTYADIFLFSGVILAISIIAVIKLLIPSNEPSDTSDSCPNS